MKVAVVVAEQKGTHMKLVTTSELENRSVEALTLIFHDFAKRLPRTEVGSIEHAKCIGSLQNIQRAMARRA